MRKTLLVFGLVLVVIALVLIATAEPTRADLTIEQELVQLVNEERASRGLNALVVDPALVTVARAHSQVMAGVDDLHHNPSLADDVTGWAAVGENVGVGPTPASIHAAFMNSQGHRDNILNTQWKTLGIGVVVSNDRIWVTQVFVDPLGAVMPTPEPGKYLDDTSISSVHYDAVYRLKERGIMEGDSLGNFNPGAPITRQQFASAIDRLLQSLDN